MCGNAVGQCAQFEASLKKELAAAEAARARFAGEFSEADFEYVVGGWRAKLARVSQVRRSRAPVPAARDGLGHWAGGLADGASGACVRGNI